MKQHSIQIGIPEMDDDIFYSRYYGIKLNQSEKNLISEEKTNNDLEIYITTFDGLSYVKYQIKTLRKFIVGINFQIIFCDTNSYINPEISRKTKELCIEEGVGYVKLPHNKFQDLESFSTKLGVDMNWIWRNCIKTRQPKYFGFLDQDCFLIKNSCQYIKDYLDNKGMYGLAWPQDPNPILSEYWLVHIMNNFFRYDFVENIDLDFRPAGFIGLDTGGCNFFSLFKNHNRLDYIQSEEFLYELGKEWKDIFREFSLHDNRWLHIKNSTKSFTEHSKEREYKELYMKGILEGILLK